MVTWFICISWSSKSAHRWILDVFDLYVQLIIPLQCISTTYDSIELSFDLWIDIIIFLSEQFTQTTYYRFLEKTPTSSMVLFYWLRAVTWCSWQSLSIDWNNINQQNRFRLQVSCYSTFWNVGGAIQFIYSHQYNTNLV